MPAFLIRTETVTITYTVVEADTEEEAKNELNEYDSRAIKDLASHQKDPIVTCCDCRDTRTPFINEQTCLNRIKQEMNA